MAGLPSQRGFFPGRRHRPAGHLVLLTVCLATLTVSPGCSGCRKTPQQLQAEREKKEAERKARELEEKRKKKPDLEIGKLVSLPYEPNAEICFFKPGHWTATSLPAKANNFNVLGDLEMSVVDRGGRLIGVPGTGYASTGSREVALPKGQPKLLESFLYVPATGSEAFASGRISARKGGRGTFRNTHPLKRMPSYQYHFVVLARSPESYKYLDGLDSVKHPSDLSSGESNLGYYRVQRLAAEKQTTLPPYALFWTSIACVLWDDAEPASLAPEQQEALVDWLHWGGQLILSGPDSLDTLRNGFLSPYLPAAGAGTRELTETDLDPLNARWTLPVHGKPGIRLSVAGPWAGVKFDVHPQGREVPGTGGLLVERRVGRGRIVVSAFELDEPELVKWPGFDGFFNACLLGRPPRQFVEEGFSVKVRWAGKGEPRFGAFDPRVVSNLRYFTRDTGTKPIVLPGTDDGENVDEFGTLGDSEEEARRLYGSDVASWCDFNAVANTARESLQNAARIEIPERTFVVWVVGAYLLVLVPANWLAFRLMGRVEWAWAAAPVIAVVSTVIVIRMARLDIGFARSATEIAVVEMQGDHPRAHVTRYTALYTSLATTYRFRFEDPGAQVQPFPAVATPEGFQLLVGQGLTELEYRYGRQVEMRGFHVMSNSTGMAHSEQIADLGGGILLEEASVGWPQVTNKTAFPVHGAGVIRKDASGQVQTAWIGTLEPDQSAELRFRPRPQTNVAGRLWADQREGSPLTAAGPAKGRLGFEKLVEQAEEPQSLRPGDVRLVGWLDEELPGLEIKPASPQSRRAALVVAHLRYGFGEDPQPDLNTRREKEGDDYKAITPGGIEDETP